MKRLREFWNSGFSSGQLLMFLVLVGGAAFVVWRMMPLLDRPETDGFEVRRIELLEQENERLRSLLRVQEREKTEAESQAARRAIEKEVEEIRGLQFLEPVDYDVVTRETIRTTVENKISQQYSDQDFENMATGLASIGLLDEGFPLKQKYLDLLGEQIAAFYDQHEHKLYMFEDASLDQMQNRVILAHELVHALQDQHFHLNKLPLDVKDNDDRAFAAAGLIEGEATMVMSEYMLKNFSLKDIRGTVVSMFGQNMEELGKAPLYLREMLLFPYMRGQEFAMVLHAHEGYEGLSEAYAHPPESTSQILHPEKFLASPREDPLRIVFPDTPPQAAKPVAKNTIGEAGMRILFTQWIDEETGKRVGSGWRGDRYATFRDDDGRVSVVWKSAWKGEKNAADYAEALRGYVAKRYGEGASGRSIVIEAKGDGTVLFIDAASPEWANTLRAYSEANIPSSADT